MAHGLTATDNMFSVRQMPWHGLGNVIEDYPGSISEALRLSGLDWQVIRRQMSYVRPEEVGGFPLDTHVKIPDQYVNVRSDNGAFLGAVTDRYKIVQNIEAFEFLDSLIGTDLMFETAGSLFGGRKTWVLAKIPEMVEIAGDPMLQYMFISNAHDGRGSILVAVTNIRIVCANTLTWAIGTAPRVYKVRHSGDIDAKLREARRAMQVVVNYNRAFKEFGDTLATQRISARRFETRVVNELFPMDDTLGGRAADNREEARAAVMSFFRGKGPAGDTLGNAPGTKWAAANAVAEYFDWGRRMTVRGSQIQRSFDDAAGKQKGLELVLAA